MIAMNQEEFLNHHIQVTTAALNLAHDKTLAYSGEGNSVFSNFEKVEALRICPTNVGILARIADKVGRLANYLNRSHNDVTINNSESFDDSILDLINYLVFLHAYTIDTQAHDHQTEAEFTDELNRGYSQDRV